MALSTQKGRSFHAFMLQIGIFGLYVAMWVKAIFTRGNKSLKGREREREMAGQALNFKGYNEGKSRCNFDRAALLT